METTETEKENKNQGEYSVTFKRWISREIESGKISVREAIERYEIAREVKTIYDWIHIYGLGKELSLSIMTPEEKLEKASLEKRIKALEKALDLAKLKNIAIETMIDVAEEQFNISIRKKAGPKQ